MGAHGELAGEGKEGEWEEAEGGTARGRAMGRRSGRHGGCRRARCGLPFVSCSCLLYVRKTTWGRKEREEREKEKREREKEREKNRKIAKPKNFRGEK
jgi:hypothetical protein